MNEDEHSMTEAGLMPASLGTRAAAFVLEVVTLFLVISPVVWLAGFQDNLEAALIWAGFALYFAIFEGLRGRTPGKFYSRIRVVGTSGPPGIPGLSSAVACSSDTS